MNDLHINSNLLNLPIIIYINQKTNKTRTFPRSSFPHILFSVGIFLLQSIFFVDPKFFPVSY